VTVAAGALQRLVQLASGNVGSDQAFRSTAETYRLAVLA